MAKQSAGLLLYRQGHQLEVLLVHPGGPFWARKDKGVWSIPKGEFIDEEPLAAAKREFGEETGQQAPSGTHADLGTVKQSSGKVIYGWAIAGDFDVTTLMSNDFSMEWPPKSGQQQVFPEVDRAEWFSLDRACIKIHPSQVPFLDRLATHLGVNYKPPEQASLF